LFLPAAALKLDDSDVGGRRAMRIFPLILGLAASAVMTSASLRAEDAVNAPVYLVAYFEVAPSAAAQTADLLRQYAGASRTEDGNTSLDAFQEIGRPNRFAIVEAWRDKKAVEAHNSSAATSTLRDRLQPLLASPLDVRPSGALSIAAPKGPAGADVIFVLTHVDVVPTGKDQGIVLVKELAEAGRKDPTNLQFDVLQQDSRPNHFTLAEAWRGRSAFEANVTAAHTKDFRQKLTPLSGALYDERLYQALR
jgi:quinol monooxygenase YgiN